MENKKDKSAEWQMIDKKLPFLFVLQMKINIAASPWNLRFGIIQFILILPLPSLLRKITSDVEVHLKWTYFSDIDIV
jgi:hypothetical protein